MDGTSSPLRSIQHEHPQVIFDDMHLRIGLARQSLKRWDDDGDVGHIVAAAEKLLWICVKSLGWGHANSVFAAALQRAREAAR